MWSAIARILAVVLEWAFGVWQKREQEAADPVNKTEDLQSDITAHDEAAVQDAFRRADVDARVHGDSDV